MFIQHVALKVPERAEFRLKASQAIVLLMRGLSGPKFKKVVEWFFRWAHNEKVAHRQFSVEVMGRLLQEDERENEDLDVIQEESPQKEPEVETAENDKDAQEESQENENEENPYDTPYVPEENEVCTF